MAQASEKTEKGTIPSVAIDGARIRSVRETKKLTQLYVASVVGVTTDTISRWENNRYPSIKRDNAEKLAGALEVDLAEILRQEEVTEVLDLAPPEPPIPQQHRLLLWSFAALVVLLLVAILVFTQRPLPEPTAVRWVPNFAAPGEVIPVQIKVTRQGDEKAGFILKEKLPDGWRLVSSLPASSAIESSGSIKWLMPGGSASATVSYTIKIPATPALRKDVKLNGEIVLRVAGTNRTETVAGSNSVKVGAYHWADTNGDGRIDDDEIMPAYYIYEEMKGLGLDWTIIEAIWSGKGYRWDPKGGFQVIN